MKKNNGKVCFYLSIVVGMFFGKVMHSSVGLCLTVTIQCPLDIETLDKAAALDLATATPLTDLRQYINSNLGFRDLEI